MNCKYYCGECEEYYFRRYTDINEKHDKCGEFSNIVWGSNEDVSGSRTENQDKDE